MLGDELLLTAWGQAVHSLSKLKLYEKRKTLSFLQTGDDTVRVACKLHVFPSYVVKKVPLLATHRREQNLDLVPREMTSPTCQARPEPVSEAGIWEANQQLALL